MRRTRPRCLLPDADVIIAAYELQAWERILKGYCLAIPSIVVHEEARFWSRDADEVPAAIDLPQLAEQGRVRELSCSAQELDGVASIFDKAFRQGLHEGELEALALIHHKKAASCYFCTGDKLAIQALAMLGFSNRAISFEVALSLIGFQKPVARQFTRAYLQEHLKIGRSNRVTGTGLSRPLEL